MRELEERAKVPALTDLQILPGSFGHAEGANEEYMHNANGKYIYVSMDAWLLADGLLKFSEHAIPILERKLANPSRLFEKASIFQHQGIYWYLGWIASLVNP